LGRLSDLSRKRTSTDFDPFRGELEKFLEAGISGNKAKTATRGFGVRYSQPGKQSVSTYGASPATDATRTAASRADSRGIPIIAAKLTGTRERSNAPKTRLKPVTYGLTVFEPGYM
jgi:hypothetical protein